MKDKDAMMAKFDRQNAEFDTLTKLAEQWRRLQMTPIVDDDYPEVRTDYEGALADFLVALGANRPSKFNFLEHLRHQAEWSKKTFGPGPRVEGVTDHIAKELVEVRESGGALAEWVDVIILGLDGAWRSGATPEQIVAAITAKQSKNESRTWPDWRTMPANVAIEHDRTTSA